MWIKIIHPNGHISNVDWQENYNQMRKAIPGTENPGYLLHESGLWSPIHKKWIFAPRRVSREPYDEKLDETRGSNIIIVSDEQFESINYFTIGELNKFRGF